MAEKTMSSSEKSGARAARELRTTARKAKHELANAAQHKANLVRLAELGIELRPVTNRRPPRHAIRMTPSKALRLHDRAVKFATKVVNA